MNRDVLRRAKKGDQSALKEIFETYGGLIRQTGKKFFSQIEDNDDFEQIARIGIWEAVTKYRLAPVFRATVRGGKVRKFTLIYDKHDVDFGRFAFMYTRKNTNLSVRKERKRLKESDYPAILSAKPSLPIDPNSLDNVLGSIKEELHTRVLDSLVSLQLLDLILQQKSEYAACKMLGLGQDEFLRLKNELMSLAKDKIQLSYAS